MKVGFVVNDIATESENYTTTRLAMAAVNRGHEAWLIGSGDMAFDPDDHVPAAFRKRITNPQRRFLKNFKVPRVASNALRSTT